MNDDIKCIDDQLHILFERSVDKYPNHQALICDEYCLTYKELDDKANQLANYLLRNGYKENDVIAILVERSLNSYIAILAILKIGATYVPIDVNYPDERVNYIFSDLPFSAVLTSSSQIARALTFPEQIVLDEINSLLNIESTSRPMRTTNEQSGDNLCYVIYTSGSTGKPKGVEIMHRNICHYVRVASDIYAMTAADKVYQGFSLAFDASLEEIWMAFANGATLVACTDKETRSGLGLLDFLEKHQVTVFSTVPTLLSSLEGRADYLRLLILGGEACTANLVNRWMRPDLQIMNTYGPTEATVIATYAECKPNQPVSIGKPIPGYEVLILNEQLQPVANNTAGELCIGGAGLARGYVNLPTATADQFIEHPFDKSSRLYRTGDLAFISDEGDIHFAGRIDNQVKLRGFRIELNEIETVIMEYPMISQAVVSLQTLDQPTLVAYLLVSKESDFDLIQFRLFLRDNLPDYMMPGLFERVEEFPLLASGKVDRNALPKPTQTATAREYIAPVTPLEKQLSAIWEETFGQKNISVTADFFYDLGGHSLLAAKAISRLRKVLDFQTTSILDLYQNPSIRQLANKIEQNRPNTESNKSNNRKERPVISAWKYYLCGFGQFLGCLFQYGMSAWQLLLIVLSYYWLTDSKGFIAIDSIALYMILFLVMPLAMTTITISAKWLLLGRVKPGEYPVWGWFYFRWWLVQRLQQNVYEPKLLLGTPLINLYYRLLGAKIGKGCYIATQYLTMPDMICIGDDCSIGQDSRLLGYIVEDGWLKIGTITLGDNCFVGARSVIDINSTMENNAVLDDMSMLSEGVIPREQFYSGSPARKTTIPVDHITTYQNDGNKPSLIQTINYGFLHYFALVFIVMLYFTSYLPGLMVLEHFYKHGSYLTTMLLGAPIAAAMFFIVHFSVICLVKRLIIPKSKTGTYSLTSFYYLRQWLVAKMLDIDEIAILSDSLFFPQLLKMLGAKIGKNVEMGEAPLVMPDFVEIKEGGFTASGVALAWPSVYKGHIRYGRVKIEQNAFVGNASLIPHGAVIGKGGLIGCLSIPPSENRASEENSAWLGSPPMFLPVREIMGGFPDEVTFNPSNRLYYTRLFIELFRVLLPTTCSLILICNLYYAIAYLLAHNSILTTALVLPVVDLGLNLLIIGGLIALKWKLLGRIKASIKPLWDVFIWKNDIREFTYGYYINPHLTNLILGTPFIALLYRAMGSKIGKRVFIDTEGFAEFDLIRVDDDVCINGGSLIQTHLYEDRIFKLGSLHIKKGCNVGVNSMVLYNTVMEPNSSLGSCSLLMKGETLPTNTRWEGSPAQSVISKVSQPAVFVEYGKIPSDVYAE